MLWGPTARGTAPYVQSCQQRLCSSQKHVSYMLLLEGLGDIGILLSVMQYEVKPCVRGFGEIPTDQEFDNGDLTLVMDDANPGRSCICCPGYYKRLTITAKVRQCICIVSVVWPGLRWTHTQSHLQ